MSDEKDDEFLALGLSLGLTCEKNIMNVMNPSHGNKSSNFLDMNLMVPLRPTSHLNKTAWNQLLHSSSSEFPAARNCETRTFYGEIDVNRAPSSVVDLDEENCAVSSPNSTVSTISGKRNERDSEIEAERTSCSRGGSEDEDGGGGGGGGDGDGDGDGDAQRKKLRLSREQSMLLEETFKEHNTLNPKQKLVLAEQLNLRQRQVEVWFQNRRARTKLKQTEVNCEYLKRCCENLTRENRRLQKEVQELRALKLSPQLYMHMNPPTTLTMCPSCERMALSSSSTSSAAPSSSSTSAPAAPSQLPFNSSSRRPLSISPWPGLQMQSPLNVPPQ